MKTCECGCGTVIASDKKYSRGHNQRGKKGPWTGKKLPEETLDKMRTAKRMLIVIRKNTIGGKQSW